MFRIYLPLVLDIFINFHKFISFFFNFWNSPFLFHLYLLNCFIYWKQVITIIAIIIIMIIIIGRKKLTIIAIIIIIMKIMINSKCRTMYYVTKNKSSIYPWWWNSAAFIGSVFINWLSEQILMTFFIDYKCLIEVYFILWLLVMTFVTRKW